MKLKNDCPSSYHIIYMVVNKSELIKNINGLSRDEKKHIFNILIESGCQYSLNNNGYFYNLSYLSDEFQVKLLKCTELIFRHRTLINEFEKKRAIKITEYQQLINTNFDIKKKQLDIILDITDIDCNIKWTIDKKKIDKISYPYIPVSIAKNSVYQRIHDNMRELHKLNKQKQIVQHYTPEPNFDANLNNNLDDNDIPDINDFNDIVPEIDNEDIDELENSVNIEVETDNLHIDIIHLIKNIDENDKCIDIKFINHCESLLNDINFSKEDICIIQNFITQYYLQEKVTFIKKSVFKKLSRYKQIVTNRDPSIIFQFILSIENLV